MERTISSKLNLGCGDRFREGWINVNFTSTGPGVVAANLREGIPFPNETFDIVYHSHLLEHFEKSIASYFLEECIRVLKPNGVIRVVVPDLEAITRNYLVSLQRARAGIEGWDHNYDWMLLEMYDQTVRNQSGGDMARYLSQESIPNEQFVIDRCGEEVRNIIVESKSNKPKNVSLTELGTGNAPTRFRKFLRLLHRPHLWKEKLIGRLLKNELETLNIGRFHLCGENHKWMYDSYSLGRLLRSVGFKEIAVREASESYILGWSNFNLDTEADGSVYKPDSLFIEALKK